MDVVSDVPPRPDIMYDPSPAELSVADWLLLDETVCESRALLTVTGEVELLDVVVVVIGAEWV